MTNNQAREKIYQFIVAYKQLNDGNSPSMRDVAYGVNTSLSNAQHHLRCLEAEGRISLGDAQRRHITIKGGQWSLQ